MDKPKVLYVSDSLGTPIHPRGIFNYSVSLIEILKQLGYHVTLVVEQVAGYGVPDGVAEQFGKFSMDAVGAARLAEIYRYFNERSFHFNWRYKTRLFRTLVERTPRLAQVIQRIVDRLNPGARVENRIERLDFVPAKGEHLATMDAFLVRNYFYSSSMSRAVNGLDPVEIDATGYDLVVVDTPHYVKVTGIAPKHILAIIHDLIPLRDPTMGADWRRLFIKKMEASLSLDSNLVFVSNFTQSMFHMHFPHRKIRKEIVLYPPLRSSLVQAASKADGPKNYMRRLYTQMAGAQGDIYARDQAVWDATQPYFVATLSDEPRKNIAVLVEAFDQLKSRANMVIVGQIDEKRYLGQPGDDHPNIYFTGYVTEADKIAIIRQSTGMILPSFSEGFGIPIVEGAVLGVPVLCSDIAVFREIAEDLGNYFDPHDPDSLVAAVEGALQAPGPLRKRAAALRETVIARFSQAAMAKRLADAIADIRRG